MKSQTNTGYVAFLSLVAAIGGILFGYDTAVISGTISGVASQFSLDAMQQGWFVGCALVGSIGGVAVAGVLSDRFGRKLTMLLSAVLFTVSAVGCAVSADFTQLVVYRIVGGVGIGVVSIVSPMYISEVAVARWRGTLVSLYQLAITVGFLAAYLVNFQILKSAETAAYASPWMQKIWVTELWRGMFGAETLPALLFFTVIFFIPESPRWLVLRGRDVRAHAVLQRIYRSSEAADEEIAAVHGTASASSKSEWRVLFEPGIRKAVVIGVFIAILGQFMGAVLRPDDLRKCRAVERRFALLAGARGCGQHADLGAGACHHRPRGTQTTGLLGCVGHDRFAALHRVLFHVRRGAGIAQRIPAGVLPGLYFLLRRFYLRRGVGAALGDVPHPGARAGDVDRRACAVGGHLPHRAADALDARKPYARRHVLPLRGDVRPLYVDYLACRSRNHGALA